MTEPTTRTLDVPDAVLHYDIRTSESTTEPPLLFGSPMPASGFVTLASHFTDRTVAARAATAVAGRLGTTPAIFPGAHDGFLGGEYGSTGKPEAFAAALCGVLTEVAAELAQDRTARCCGTSVRT